jgi:hypothetical protein
VPPYYHGMVSIYAGNFAQEVCMGKKATYS